MKLGYQARPFGLMAKFKPSSGRLASEARCHVAAMHWQRAHTHARIGPEARATPCCCPHSLYPRLALLAVVSAEATLPP